MGVELFLRDRTTVFLNLIDANVAAKMITVVRTRVRPRDLGPDLGRNPATVMAKATIKSVRSAIGGSSGLIHLKEAWINREIR